MKYELISLLEHVLGASSPSGEDNIAFNCPNPRCKSKNSDRRKKLIVKIDTGQYHCWVCQLKGSNLQSLFRYNKNINKGHYRQLKELLASSVDYSKFNDISNLIKSDEILTLPVGSYPLYSKKTYSSMRALDYLVSRGLNHIDIVRYNIHFVETGRYANRIIIPTYNDRGILMTFSARSIYPKVIPKYDGPKVNRADIIGFELFINWNLPVILTEGYIDAIIAKYNSIPLAGTFLPKLLFSKLKIHRPKIYVCLDGEAFEYSLLICSKLFHAGLEVYNIKLPDGEDPASLGTDSFWKYVDEARHVNLKYIMENKLLLN